VQDHHLAIGVDALAMKCRLDQAPLTPPELAFAIEKPLAEEAQLPTEVPALYKLAILLDQHVLGMIGVTEQV